MCLFISLGYCSEILEMGQLVRREERFNPCVLSGHGHSAGSVALKPLVGQDIMVGARSEVNLLSSWDQEVKGDKAGT